MKINKGFAPFTIVVETKEDVEFLFAVLRDAERGYMAHGPIFSSSRRHTDTYMQKINYFLGQLQ